MAKVLVTGGCGYIGSHTLVDLIAHGHQVVSIDNLWNSTTQALEGIKNITGADVKNYQIDLRDSAALEQVFTDHTFDAIIHFAALKSVGESVEKPLLYYENNIVGIINLLQCQQKHNIQHFIFSSSCSVYGNAKQLPVTEQTPLARAESPYARTKQFCEDIIFDLAVKDTQSSFILLRYFNPAGAHPSIEIGEAAKTPASNLVPVVTETAIGKRQLLQVFGSDYPTRDGTCIRDYIYIMDLAHGHTKALEYLLRGEHEDNVEIFNLGSGTGSTVLEVIKAFEKVSNQKLNYALSDRRRGDVVAIYADYGKAATHLGWTPKTGIEEIMHTAWQWELKRNNQLEERS